MVQSKGTTDNKTSSLFMKKWCWWTVKYWRTLNTLTLFLFGRQYFLNEIRDILPLGCSNRRMSGSPTPISSFNYKGLCTYYVTKEGGGLSKWLNREVVGWWGWSNQIITVFIQRGVLEHDNSVPQFLGYYIGNIISLNLTKNAGLFFSW